MICPDCLVKERVTEGPNVDQPCLKYNELVTGHRRYQNIFRQGSLARAWRRRPCVPARQRAPVAKKMSMRSCTLSPIWSTSTSIRSTPAVARVDSVTRGAQTRVPKLSRSAARVSWPDGC